uniref:Uncharacterized protein n=1 Tax=Anguilla anguilla TaxID=7936 RepID=A0A0E9RLW9_ANGAN
MIRCHVMFVHVPLWLGSATGYARTQLVNQFTSVPF